MQNKFFSFKKNKGQILIFAIFVFMILFLFTLIIIETGNFLFNKIHLQNAADSAALEGGTWYARFLNVISISNKVLAGAYGIGLINLSACKIATTIVKEIQDGLMIGGVIAINGFVMFNEYQNGLKPLPPILNGEDDDKKKLITLNLRRAQLFENYSRNVIYYYKEGDRKIYFPESMVEYNNKARRWQLKYPVPTKNGPRRYFVTREIKTIIPEKMNFLDTFLEEDGEHTVYVIAYKGKDKFIIANNFKDQNGKKIEPGMLYTNSKVIVDGGSLDVFDINGAQYTPKITRAGLPIKIDFLDDFLKKFLLH